MTDLKAIVIGQGAVPSCMQHHSYSLFVMLCMVPLLILINFIVLIGCFKLFLCVCCFFFWGGGVGGGWG